MAEKKVEQKKEKRIRRSFVKIIMDKLENRYQDINDSKVNILFNKISTSLEELEGLRKSGGRLTKGKIRKLQGFSKEQIEAYLEMIKNNPPSQE